MHRFRIFMVICLMSSAFCRSDDIRDTNAASSQNSVERESVKFDFLEFIDSLQNDNPTLQQKKDIEKKIRYLLDTANKSDTEMESDTLWAAVIFYLRENKMITEIRELLNSKSKTARKKACMLYDPAEREASFVFWLYKFSREKDADVKKVIIDRLKVIYAFVPDDQKEYYNKFLDEFNLSGKDLLIKNSTGSRKHPEDVHKANISGIPAIPEIIIHEDSDSENSEHQE